MKNTVLKIIAFLRPYAVSTVSISAGVAIMITLVSYNLTLFRVEAYLYDIRMKLKGSEAPHPDIVLLATGENDPAQNDSKWEPNSLESQLDLLEILVAQKPKAILFLNRFDPNEVETKPLVAEKFVKTANAANAYGTKVVLGTDVDLGGEVLPPYPLSLLSHAPAVLHKDGSIFGEDKVMRRGLLTVYDEASVHMHAAYPNADKKELFNIVKNMRGSYFFRPAESWHIMIRYPQNTSEQTKFPMLHYSDLKSGKVSVAQNLAGKIIVIDNLRKDAMNDYAFTPYSRITYTNPRIIVHASILDTILKNRGLIIIPSKLIIVITLLLTFLLSFITITKSPSRGVMALLLLSGGLFLISLALFKMGLWLRLVHPLLSMFFAYYLIVPYRAILEYKKRWEVQEKHDLLVQVEELKGNFLSLMSHDLKTPVARIQGLAELILRQGEIPNQQQENMKQIISSTENLDKFITKILNLTKVESNEIKLNRRSKDINKIIEQCVQKLEFQARNKNIKFNLSLDPLFPLQLDAALIIQVFTNIIDNAIKYSPPGSQVEISSKELKGCVEVVIRDMGQGMDEEEKQQLFTKFFRGKSHPGDQNKGSGLGLYLSKYFIELHEGSVRVETKKNVGSEFVIQLPM